MLSGAINLRKLNPLLNKYNKINEIHVSLNVYHTGYGYESDYHSYECSKWMWSPNFKHFRKRSKGMELRRLNMDR
jgi:hypothetical protein